MLRICLSKFQFNIPVLPITQILRTQVLTVQQPTLNFIKAKLWKTKVRIPDMTLWMSLKLIDITLKVKKNIMKVKGLKSWSRLINLLKTFNQVKKYLKKTKILKKAHRICICQILPSLMCTRTSIQTRTARAQWTYLPIWKLRLKRRLEREPQIWCTHLITMQASMTCTSLKMIIKR